MEECRYYIKGRNEIKENIDILNKNWRVKFVTTKKCGTWKVWQIKKIENVYDKSTK